MEFALIGSIEIAVILCLIALVLTGFTDAFWYWLDDRANRIKRLARRRLAKQRGPRHAGSRNTTGR